MLIALIIVSSLLGIAVVAFGVLAFLFYHLMNDYSEAKDSENGIQHRHNELLAMNHQQTLQMAEMKVELQHYKFSPGAIYKPKQQSHSASVKHAEDVEIYE